MKLKDFKSVVWSQMGDVQWVVVWSRESGILADGCSAEYAYLHFGDLEVTRIRADRMNVVFCVEEEV